MAQEMLTAFNMVADFGKIVSAAVIKSLTPSQKSGDVKSSQTNVIQKSDKPKNNDLAEKLKKN